MHLESDSKEAGFLTLIIGIIIFCQLCTEKT